MYLSHVFFLGCFGALPLAGARPRALISGSFPSWFSSAGCGRDWGKRRSRGGGGGSDPLPELDGTLFFAHPSVIISGTRCTAGCVLTIGAAL